MSKTIPLKDEAEGRVQEDPCHAAADALEKSKADGENKFWQAKRVIMAYAQAATNISRPFDWMVKCPYCQFIAQGYQHCKDVSENPHLILKDHVNEKHEAVTFLCNRRSEGPSNRFPGKDHWGERDGKRCCSYCGSIHPEDLFKAIEEGKAITPTDKNYKIYVDGTGSGKFYFQHLDADDQKRFYDLHKAGKMKLEYPGHFYKPPFFFGLMSSKGTTSDPNDPAVQAARTGGPDTKPTPQHEKYLVLSEEERARGFVRPVRASYVHVGPPGPKYPIRDLTPEEAESVKHTDWVKFEDYPVGSGENSRGKYWSQADLDKVGKGCGCKTTMGRALAETYAAKPGFYGSTYCVGCSMHLEVGKDGEFVWDGTEERVGT